MMGFAEYIEICKVTLLPRNWIALSRQIADTHDFLLNCISKYERDDFSMGYSQSPVYQERATERYQERNHLSWPKLERVVGHRY